MKKVLLVLILGLFLISLASAQEDQKTWGYVESGVCISLTQTCGNCTFVNITEITYPNKTDFGLGEPIKMQKTGTSYNHSFCNTNSFGVYIISGDHDRDGEIDIWNANFESNYNGSENTTAQSILYLGLLAIFVFILFIAFFVMNLLPKSNTPDEEGKIMSVNYLKYFRLPLWLFIYFLFIALVFLSSNIAFAFLQEQMFGKILFAIYSILFALSPVVLILIVISFFVKIIEDKKLKKMMSRGMFPQGRA